MSGDMTDGTATTRPKRDVTYLVAIPIVWLLQVESVLVAIGVAPLTEVTPFLGFLAVTLYAAGRRSRLRHGFVAVTVLAALITVLELAVFVPAVFDSGVWMDRMQGVLRVSFPASLIALAVAHVAFTALCALSFARPGLAGRALPARPLVLAAPSTLALHFGLQIGALTTLPPLTLVPAAIMALVTWRMRAAANERWRLAAAAAALLCTAALAELAVRGGAVPALLASPAWFPVSASAMLCAQAMFAAAVALPASPREAPVDDEPRLAA